MQGFNCLVKHALKVLLRIKYEVLLLL